MKARELLQETILDVQKSDTTEQIYTICWSQVTGYTCDCIGYSTKRKYCKHIKRFKAKVQVTSLLTEYIPFEERKGMSAKIVSIVEKEIS